MTESSVLVNALRDSLYDATELYAGYKGDSWKTYLDTLDFRIYKDFVVHGKAEGASGVRRVVQSLHDGSIGEVTHRFTADKKVVAFMGGHKVARSRQGIYRQVVEMSKTLTENGIVVSSGGGPGAMEAAHLGAFLANKSLDILNQALERLEAVPLLPKGLENLINAHGQVDETLAQGLHKWLKPAIDLAREYGPGSESLGVPTWHYGQEPSTPFATHIAKYFQNSIREDGMLLLATYGIIYVEGKAGTLQEIFQDAAQNYYETFGWASPMIFFGIDQWTNKLPVKSVLDNLFKETTQNKKDLLIYTDDPRLAIRKLLEFKPPTPERKALY